MDCAQPYPSNLTVQKRADQLVNATPLLRVSSRLPCENSGFYAVPQCEVCSHNAPPEVIRIAGFMDELNGKLFTALPNASQQNYLAGGRKFTLAADFGVATTYW